MAKKAPAKRPARRKAPAVHGQKVVNLALQGGGSHGAFTWGALECLLDEPRLKIEGISGASAGAMNAVMLAAGLVKGGVAGAKAELERFWQAVSEQNSLSPVQRAPLDVLLGNWGLSRSPSYIGYDALSHFLSPYQSNPMDINPLKALVKELVDFKALKKCREVELFISATNVRTGRARIFTRGELTPDVMAASSCLPLLFQAVKIGRDYYWDGGYMGNPPLWPLIYYTQSCDIVIVQTSPLTRDKLPTSPIEISERVNEITFNSSLKHEIRAINFVARLLAKEQISARDYKHMLLHRIHNEALFDRFEPSSKMNAEWDFLQLLRKKGRHTAGEWLRQNWRTLGKKASFSVRSRDL